MKLKYTFLLLAVLSGFALQASQIPAKVLDGFHTVYLSGSIEKVVFKKGDTPSIQVNGDDQARVSSHVDNNSLYVSCNKKLKKGAVLTITFTEIEAIYNSGNTHIEFKSSISGDHFNYVGSGSGSLVASINTNSLEVILSGSGFVDLSGSAQSQTFITSGSGHVHCKDLKGETGSIVLSGSSMAVLNISGDVRSQISGSGKVQNVAE
ncbi:MAG: DUF2807 domain-containing protein [Saprospiraceae bacterium]